MSGVLSEKGLKQSYLFCIYQRRRFRSLHTSSSNGFIGGICCFCASELSTCVRESNFLSILPSWNKNNGLLTIKLCYGRCRAHYMHVVFMNHKEMKMQNNNTIYYLLENGKLGTLNSFVFPGVIILGFLELGNVLIEYLLFSKRIVSWNLIQIFRLELQQQLDKKETIAKRLKTLDISKKCNQL